LPYTLTKKSVPDHFRPTPSEGKKGGGKKPPRAAKTKMSGRAKHLISIEQKAGGSERPWKGVGIARAEGEKKGEG